MTPSLNRLLPAAMLVSAAVLARGELTLRDVTRPVTVPFTAKFEAAGAHIQGDIDINRHEFGVGQGDWSTGESVPLVVSVSFEVLGHAVGVGVSTSPSPVARDDWQTATVSDYQPTPAFANQTRAPSPPQKSAYRVVVLASHLEHPWSLAFLPGGRILLTERPGRMRVLAPDGTLSAPIHGVPPVKVIAAEGLHDVLLAPQFEQDHRIYFSYFAPLSNHDSPPTRDEWSTWLKLPAGEHERHPYGFERVARAELSRDFTRLEHVKVILQGGNRRLAWAQDGTLFVTAAAPAGGGIPVDMEPQRLNNTYGKVLRVYPDGSVPRDNPFVRAAGARADIYAYGLRDPEGAAVDPGTGFLWTSENGPRGGDEINIIRPGANYGFPLISYGREYSGKLISAGHTTQEGLEQPVYFWTPSVAPSGLLFYTGSLFPDWRGSLFCGAMAGKRLIRLVLEGDRVKYEEDLLAEYGKRIRDVRQGPDGALYVLTEEEDGELLKLVPPDEYT